ncbi:MAG: HAMP domain-containing histidine kinase, partial [Verrucomicrobiaceae bacterium]
MAEARVNLNESDEELRRAFREYEDGVAYENARRTAVFSAVFMLLASSLDWVILPQHGVNFLLIRAICAVLVGVIFFLLGRNREASHIKVLAQGITLLPLISICVMIAMTEGGNSDYYAGLNLILVGLSLLLRWSFWNTLGMILSTFICYTAAVYFSSTIPDFKKLFGNCFFLAVTSVFVLAGSYFYERLRFSEFCLRMQVEKSRELLESQNRQLSELDEAKTRFFANISHELRTPLTIMLGITERLRSVISRQTSSEPIVNEMTLMLEQNGLRLLKLIDDLLDLVRFDTGHADINRQPTLIGAHIEGLLRSLRHLAEQDRVALLWECRSDNDSISLDRDKFDKILLNLVINAIKFTPSSGTIEVKVVVEDGRLKMTVEDTGVGIPPEVLPRIFERFWQVDTSSTRKFQGAGIG